MSDDNKKNDNESKNPKNKDLGVNEKPIEEKLKETENKIIAIKQELHHIESTYVWKWFFCENEVEKESILQTLFGLMYANSHNPGP